MRQLVILLLFAPLTLFAAPATVPVQPDSAMDYVRILSDPELFHGRKSGTEVGNQAFIWAAERFAQWGLKPLIGKQLAVKYDQLACIEKTGKLSLLDSRHGRVDYQLGVDFIVCANSGTAKLDAPVTIVGYGISRPEKGWDDYEHMDLTGRIAVITRGTPPSDEKWQEEFSRTYLYPEAVKHGAVAVLFYHGDKPTNGAAIQAGAYNPDVPAGYIGATVLDQLLYGTGYTGESYRRELKKGPLPLELERRLYVEFETEPVENAFGYNVVGVVEGTDRKLKKEAIVIGGHGDHVGPNAEGIYYVGADDNASGAGVVMELARSFAAFPQPRTLIFCLFGAEEQGLLGSEALVEQLPAKYTYVTMLNLDMAGRGEGITNMGGGDQVGEIWHPWYNSLPDSVRSMINGTRAWGGYSSDHAPFREKGIPAFTCSSRGNHDFYHSADDHFYTIQHPAIAGVVTSMALWIKLLAGHAMPLSNNHLEARTVWHRSTPFVWYEATESTVLDMELAETARRHGFLGIVLTLPHKPSSGNPRAIDQLLLSYDAHLENAPHLLHGENFTSARRNAYSTKGSVLVGIQGDSLVAADTLNLEVWSKLGLNWVKIENPDHWIVAGGIAAELQPLAAIIKRKKLTLQLPLEQAVRTLPLARLLGNQALFIGDAALLEELSEGELQEIRDSGAGIVLLATEQDLDLLSNSRDRLANFRIHVQPAGENYDSALRWTDKAIEIGMDREELLDWLGGHSGRW